MKAPARMRISKWRRASAVRTTDAAWTLVAVLALLLWPRPEPPAPGCMEPAELAAVGGWTDRVACAGGPPVRGPARLLFGGRLDLNCSSADALEVLPGIGPARAAAIVAERCQRPLARAEDLVRVPGIGPHTAARVRPWVEVRPSADSSDLSDVCRRSCDGEGEALPGAASARF